MKYTLDTLKKINERFIESHRMKESDVEMANAYVELIERTRSTTEPQSGDLIQYTDEHGNYYSAAHIEFVVWTWRNIAHLVSPDEYDNLDLPEDTFLMNGDLLKCKRTYNEDTHTIDTYFVWYWNEPGKDFLEVAAEQNRIREERYTLPGKKPEYRSQEENWKAEK